MDRDLVLDWLMKRPEERGEKEGIKWGEKVMEAVTAEEARVQRWIQRRW
jgi:hypothetical protein